MGCFAERAAVGSAQAGCSQNTTRRERSYYHSSQPRGGRKHADQPSSSVDFAHHSESQRGHHLTFKKLKKRLGIIAWAMDGASPASQQPPISNFMILMISRERLQASAGACLPLGFLYGVSAFIVVLSVFAAAWGGRDGKVLAVGAMTGEFCGFVMRWLHRSNFVEGDGAKRLKEELQPLLQRQTSAT